MDNTVKSIIEETLKNGEDIVISGSGSSMGNTITADDKITLSPKAKYTPHTGEIWLFKRNDGSFVIHRIIFKKNDKLFFLGDNQLTGEWVAVNNLLGIVTKIYKNGNENSAVSLQEIKKDLSFHKKRLRKYQFSKIKPRIKSYIDKYFG